MTGLFDSFGSDYYESGVLKNVTILMPMKTERESITIRDNLGASMDRSVYLVINATNATNGTQQDAPNLAFPLWATVTIGSVIGLMTLATILGNILVCMAVAIVKRLRTPSNLLIVSLAVSDLLVAVLDMPVALLTLLKGRWILGKIVCNLWVSLDVLLCTASILNLCMISVDRYFAITRPLKYAIKRTPKRMAIMIAIVWTLSATISITPLFFLENKYIENELCLISQNVGYQIYATCFAFYFPLFVMLGVYYKIYAVSLRLSEAESKSKVSASRYEVKKLLPKKPSDGNKEENHNYKNGSTLQIKFAGAERTECELVPRRKAVGFMRCFKCCCQCGWTVKCRLKKITFHHSHHHHKETKAIKTLGVIMGAFLACWLPFFILALIRPFLCGEEDTCQIPNWLSDVCLWLGYANSFLNPVIYARFNRDFRKPFKSILCLKCHKINKRIRSESYAEQYGQDYIGNRKRRDTRTTSVANNYVTTEMAAPTAMAHYSSSVSTRHATLSATPKFERDDDIAL